jgi:hypothetical protein
MNVKRTVGWITFFIGILMIIFVIYRSYHIFIGKVPPPEIFKIQEEKLPSVKKKTTPNSQEIQQEVGEILAEQLKEIFPKESITRLFNLIAWSIFAGVLILGGSQISSLGIKLLK